MNRFIVAIVLLLYGSRASAQTATGAQLSKLSWLAGKWNRTNSKPGRSGHEVWKAAEGELRGYEVTMKGADTVLFEKTRIVEKGGELFYMADVPENKNEVAFKLTKVAGDEFVCENPEHDFPKRIHYLRSGASLKATISGNGKSVEFLFERAD